MRHLKRLINKGPKIIISRIFDKIQIILMKILPIAIALSTCYLFAYSTVPTTEEIAPGIIKLTIGNPDSITPYSAIRPHALTMNMEKLTNGELPFNLSDIQMKVTDRGCVVGVPLDNDEQIYGFGMQIDGFGHRGLRKTPIVNDNPLNGVGYSHAPQPFYVTTGGYGILVNTARYTTFLCGSHNRSNNASEATAGSMASNTNDLYANRSHGDRVYIDIPGADGIEVFVIKGPDMLSAVQRYNLFSGGGALPPIWGLGFKYRVKGDAIQDSVMRFANYFRENQVPCDMIGLEPGWQTEAYSCSYDWSTERFPSHKVMLDSLNEKGYHVDLWEHAYVHPSSPIREAIETYSGDFLVWNGVVPDFLLPEARKIFSEYHKYIIDEGISGFKLDECDNSNIAYASATWCFPDMASFPSGLDGERMHQLFGSLYLNTIDDIYRNNNQRAYHNYRSSGLFMSPRSAVLYSDTYDHKEYIQALCNSAFAGLLWCPEVREANNPEDFFHRLHTVLLSPLAMVNAWYLQYPPWLQFDRYKNEHGEFLPEAQEYERIARKLINLRMQLIPYLYQAFYEYSTDGTPPFRPLVLDYPDNKEVRDISDQFMIGQSLMVAPIYNGGNKRKVYFPEGIWYDFNTNKKYEGEKTYEITTELDQLPIYVRQGTLLPLADNIETISLASEIPLNCRSYGTPTARTILFEDDGVSYDYLSGKSNKVILEAAKGTVKLRRQKGSDIERYRLKGYEFID